MRKLDVVRACVRDCHCDCDRRRCVYARRPRPDRRRVGGRSRFARRRSLGREPWLRCLHIARQPFGCPARRRRHSHDREPAPSRRARADARTGWRDHIRDPVQQLVRHGDGAPAARRAALGVRGHPDPGSRHDRRRCPAVQRPGAASLAISKPVAAGRRLIAVASSLLAAVRTIQSARARKPRPS